MALRYEDFDVSDVTTYPLTSRPSKVDVSQFGAAYDPGSGMSGWFASLPGILAGGDIRAVVDALRAAREHERPIIWGLGGHVIKTGLAPVLIDLMARGYVSAIAMNGAAMIHDFEIAIGGRTSEDVEATLGPGTFGMAEETATGLNGVINDGVRKGLGIGQAVSAHLAAGEAPFKALSVLAEAGARQIPVTVHVAVGTDIIHMHPAASGAAIGEGSLRDFRFLASSVAKLAGGAYMNCGSAVVLPEVFLKAVALVRNRGIALDGLTTVNLDFIRHYRPETNVVRRPTAGIGKGYSLVGHHELLIPLIAAGLIEASGPAEP